MLLIPCPWCGPREEIEFVCGGAAHIERPSVDANDERWAAYLYQRPNPKGPTRERWRHARGCGCWFNLVRDTATHEVLAVYRMGEAPPEAGR